MNLHAMNFAKMIWMKPGTVLMVIVFILGFRGSALLAQEAVLAAGSDHTDDGGSVDYSIGQLAYFTLTNSEGTITEGVQQPFEIYIMPGMDEPGGMVSEWQVFPNPTSGDITLKTGQRVLKNLSYQLCDVTGLLLQQHEIGEQKINIPMADLARGTYFLIIIDNNTKVITFKIVKQ